MAFVLRGVGLTPLFAGLRPLLLASAVLAVQPVSSDAAVPAPASAESQAQSSVVVKVSQSEIVVEANGQYTARDHMEIAASNDAAAAQIGQITLPFRDTADDLQIEEAYTAKSDGRKLKVDATAIFTQAPKGSPTVPMFNDLRQKVVVFPDVRAGDTIVYTVRKRVKTPFFPGAFFGTWVFPKTTAYENAKVSITAPNTLPMTLTALGAKVETASGKGTTTYTWSYAAPNPELTAPHTAVASLEKIPRLQISSFRSYTDLSHAYAALALPKAKVTAAIKARADTITAGVTDRKEQVRQLYEWVSTDIRYVSIGLGTGSIVPHDAEVTLKNGYGDCKDKAVLLTALLAAKGISSQIALISSGSAYDLSKAPQILELNHAITYIPDLDLYLDATASIEPFGSLPFDLYGKPVVRVVADGVSEHIVPVLKDGVATQNFTATMQMDWNGRFIGTARTSGTGPFAGALRAIGHAIESAGASRAAAEYFRASGSGTFDIGTPGRLDDSYALSATFSLNPQPNYQLLESFRIPSGFRPLAVAGEGLAGSMFDTELPDTEPTPCWSGTQAEEQTLFPPAAMVIDDLPHDMDLKDGPVTFKTHWSRKGRAVTVKREFTTHFDAPLCTGEVRRAAAAALAKIRDENALISLRRAPANDDAVIADMSAAITVDPTNAVGYVNRGLTYSQRTDYGPAIKDFDDALKRDPAYVLAFVERARDRALQAKDGDPEPLKLAVEDLSQAIKLKPDLGEAYQLRSQAYRKLGDTAKADADLAQATKFDPNDPTNYVGKALEICRAAHQKGVPDEVRNEGTLKCVTQMIADLSEAIASGKADARTYLMRSKAYLTLKQMAKFEADLTEAERRGSPPSEISFMRANALLSDGKNAEAMRVLNDLLAKSPDNTDYLMLRARVRLMGGQYPEAMADMNKVIARRPGDVNLLAFRARIWIRDHNYDAALKDLGAADAIDPGSPMVLEARGSAYFGKGDYARALLDFQKVLELVPGHREIRGMIDETQRMIDKPRPVTKVTAPVNRFAAPDVHCKSTGQWRPAVDKAIHDALQLRSQNKTKEANAKLEEGMAADNLSPYEACSLKWVRRQIME